MLNPPESFLRFQERNERDSEWDTKHHPFKQFDHEREKQRREKFLARQAGVPRREGTGSKWNHKPAPTIQTIQSLWKPIRKKAKEKHKKRPRKKRLRNGLNRTLEQKYVKKFEERNRPPTTVKVVVWRLLNSKRTRNREQDGAHHT